MAVSSFSSYKKKPPAMGGLGGYPASFSGYTGGTGGRVYKNYAVNVSSPAPSTVGGGTSGGGGASWTWPTTPTGWDLYNAYQTIGADYSGRGMFNSGARVASQAYEASQQPWVSTPGFTTISQVSPSNLYPPNVKPPASTTTIPSVQTPVSQFYSQYMGAPPAAGYASGYLNAAKAEVAKWLAKLTPVIGMSTSTGKSKSYVGGLPAVATQMTTKTYPPSAIGSPTGMYKGYPYGT